MLSQKILNLIIVLVIGSTLTIGLLSCDSGNIYSSENQENDNPGQLIDKIKEAAVLFDDVPREALYMNADEYTDVMSTELNLPLGKGDAPVSNMISWDVLDSLATIALQHHKMIGNDQILDLDLIKKDFPSLSKKEIVANLDEIEEVYSSQARYQLALGIIEEVKNNPPALSKPGSTQYIDFGPLSWPELRLLLMHPTRVSGTKKAYDNVREYTKRDYPGKEPWLTKADAYRHCVWNVLIAKYCKDNFSGQYAVSYAERWAKTFTDAHETGNPAPADQPLDTPMDKHNNYRGQIIFRNDAYTKKVKSFWFLGWHYKTVIKMTHNDDAWFRNNIKGKSDSALKVTTVSQINTYYNSRLVYIRDF